MFALKELKLFLVKAAKKTWSAGKDSSSTKEKDGSTTYEYKEGDWKFHDNFFGGEPYGGREVIFYKNKPVWMMTYYGAVHQGSASTERLYGFLQNALSKVDGSTVEVPCRGPNKFEDKGFKYRSNTMGDIGGFTGEEFILKDGHEVYCAVYSGGVIGE